ncbi:MAG: sigma-70 family RNA polymerase sigma factor [Sedimentisphaerales bacterium]|nr:sigma-70 family RNA polymerase sigma factor [Sedimentisphaerales bacterium]
MDTERTKTPQETAKQVEWAERLFAEYHTYIRATIKYFLKDPLEQEELYQEIFVYFIHKQIPDDVVRVPSYLYRVILDRVRDRKRKQTRYSNRLQLYAYEQSARQSDEADLFPHREQIEEVFALIDTHLTEKEADAVVFRYKHNLDVEEIARKMNVKPRTVSHYLSEGLKKLRNKLLKDDE